MMMIMMIFWIIIWSHLTFPSISSCSHMVRSVLSAIHGSLLSFTGIMMAER